MVRISLLCPTRSRPQNIERLWNSVINTVKNPEDIQLILYLDNDDVANYSTLKVPYNSVVGDRIILSQMWNECYKKAEGDILMHCGDDIIFKTKDWDKVVETEFERSKDKILLLFGDDGYWGEKFGTHCFLHKNWVKAVGYFVPPYFSSDFNDTWLNDVAKMIDRRKYIEIITEHLHPVFGKAGWDKTYKERMDRGARDNVKHLYESKLKEREKDAEKLRGVMK